MRIQNNIQALNTMRNYQLSLKEKTKSANKLSSGYRINMAADDAAGLTISEQMREQIRGLNKGSQNAQDGISYIQTGEGALSDVQSILHRMNEITIQSLNDTNTQSDRAALQAEFDELQCEIDNILDNTHFNTKNVFSEHEPIYTQLEGNLTWNQNGIHIIDDSINKLIINYRKDETSPPKQISVEVPVGEYTTQELIDEIEDVLIDRGAIEEGFSLEYTDAGTCNLNFENGKFVDSIAGGLSYLINDVYYGGSVGVLIGTTSFQDDEIELKIASGYNDTLSFEIQTFDGNITTKSITIPEGQYTRPQIIEILNNNLADTTVEAVKKGTGIKLQSDNAIITGFKGNMFRVDTDINNIYTSVFYDNVMYGSATLTEASFVGGAVITTNSRDTQYNCYTINSSNNELTLTANTGSPVTITIPEKTYSVDEMCNFLNIQFVNNGMELVASKKTIPSGEYEGIILTSTVKGLTSKVDVDSTSSAYDTLFRKREYTDFEYDASIDSESNADSTGSITGGKKIFDGNLPVKIVSGDNDKFSLIIDTSINGNINSATYTIKLEEGEYTTSSELLAHINDKLNGTFADIGYKDKIDVSYSSDNKIVLKGKAGSNIIGVNVQEIVGNDGFKELFVGHTTTYQTTKVSDDGTSTTPAKITLNQSVQEPVKINADNNKLVINQNGVDRTVILPTGDNITYDKIEEEINNQLIEKSETKDNKFSNIDVNGASILNEVKAEGYGNSIETTGNYYDKGDSREDQGNVGNYVYNDPATIQMTVKVPSNFTVDATNKSFVISINGVKKTLILDEGNYTQSQLVNELQRKIDTNFGTKSGGAIVSMKDSKLVFTARLNKTSTAQIDGKGTKIEFTSNESSFIKSLHTTKKNAEAITSAELLSIINITDDNNTFVFKYTEAGIVNTINLVLNKGTYSRQGIVNEINSQLNKANVPVTAKLTGNKLQLVSDKTGSGYAINYNNVQGGSSNEALFGDLYTYKPATALSDYNILSEITIDDYTNGFNITVNGTPYNIILDKGTYNREYFVNMLDSKLNDIGVDVTLENNKLRYTTKDSGNGTSIKMSYDLGGTSMKQIYGETTTVTPGIIADFNSNGELVLESTRPDGSLSVSSENGGIFQKAKENISDDFPSPPVIGYISNKTAYIDGVNISEPIEITKWNNNLSFKYTANGVTKNISLSLDEKEYTYSEIVTALQDKINQTVQGELVVSANDNGIRIETVGVGNKYKLSDVSGGMYYHILSNSSVEKNMLSPNDSLENGVQNVDSAFTVGRRNVKNQSVDIENNINDILTFDLKYGNSETSFTIKLDQGKYIGESLTDEIQKKLDIKLQNQGFPAGMIEVGIGGVSTGVSGSNDSNALVLKMSKTVALPVSGEYIIDGVRGSAAFSIFYQSDGKMVPAYAKGVKDISKGIEITSENNQLAFDVDGTNYSITLAEKEYTGEELIDEINDKLNVVNAPIVAKMDDNSLRLSYKSYGEHIIDNFSGSAKRDLLFQENSAEGEKEVVHIQLSSRGGEENPDGSGSRIGQDGTVIDKFVLNTVALGINSITISKPKYANKAIGRLAKANEMISEIRSYYGAAQNRLESSIRGNDNTSENTQAAESRIRDVDMDDEMVKNSKYSILQQASQAVLAQANSSAEGILTLLK